MALLSSLPPRLLPHPQRLDGAGTGRRGFRGGLETDARRTAVQPQRDGVLERLKNEKIAEIFNGRLSVPEIKDALMEACDGKTRDNFSFYIITIQKVEDSMGFKQNILSFLYSFI